MKIVVIGGSTAGHNACVRLRQKYPDAGITLLSEEKFPFYDRRKLLDFWAGRIREKELYLNNPDFYPQNRIDYLKECKAVSVNPSRRTVSYKCGEKRTSVEYDFLVIASGARIQPPEIEGINKSGVFRFEGLDDFKELKDTVMSDAVAIIGINHLTAKIIDSVIAKNIEVKLISALIPENLPAQVEAIDSEVTELIGDSGVQAIKLKEGKIIGVSWVGVMSDLLPNADFLKDSGIEMQGRAIAVDELMRTSFPDIFACGSVCLRRGEDPRIKTWEESRDEGIAVAENLLKS